MADEQDTDEVAIDTGPSPGERLAGNAMGDVRVKSRSLSQTTREAFKQNFSPGGKYHVPEGTAEHDDLVPAIGDSASDDKSAGDGVAAPAPSSQQSPGAPSAEAAAIVAHHQEMARQLAERDELLKKREASLKDYVQRFRDDPSETIRDLIREAHGIERDEDLKPIAFELVGDLTGQVLGLEVPESVRAKAERQRAERIIKSHQRKLAEAEQREKQRNEQLEAERRDVAAQSVLRTKLTEKSAAYPYLMLEDEPHVLVWKVADQLIKQDPSWTPSWEDAAKRAEQYLKSQASAYYDKRKHLLSPAPPKPTTQNGTTQERAPGSRSSVTLSNADAQEPPRPSNGARPMTNEDRRRASLQKLRAQLPSE